MKNTLFLLGVVGLSNILNAQEGKVGINTETPTEILDVNGTMRVRTLPEQGEAKIYTKGTDEASQTNDQVFTPVSYVVADANGVLGLSNVSPKVENTTSEDILLDESNGDTGNDSNAMFVKKTYVIGNNPTNIQKHTGFDVKKWDAVISTNSMKRDKGATMTAPVFYADGNIYQNNAVYEIKLDVEPSAVQTDGNQYWRIVGDITEMEETWEATILFIKKKYVATDSTPVIYRTGSTERFLND